MRTILRPSFLKGSPAFGPASFYRSALGIVVPVMLQMVIASLISLVDNFMVAGLGDVKMAAVNVANQINFVYIVLVNAACLAGGIFLSQHRGASDAEGARFLRLATPSFAPLAIAAAIGSSYRDVGKTKAPLIISSAAAALCTLLNWLLIYGALGAPRLEVGGSAIATDIARIGEAAAFLAYVAARKPAFHFRPRELLRVDRALFARMLGKSAMLYLSETAWVMSETIITALYNGRGGAETVAGMGAGWTIANIFFMAFGAVNTATSVIVGSTLGAGRLEEARSKARWLMFGSLAFGALVGAVAASSTFLIPLVFGNLSPEARAVTRGLVLIIAAYIPLWTLLNAQFALSRAGGDTTMGLWVDVGVTYAVFLPIAFCLAWLTSLGPVALFALAKLSDFGKISIAFWWLSKEKWVKNLAAKVS